MKSKRYRFYKADNGRWFIDLPECEGSKNDLETACGADDMLDYVSKRKKGGLAENVGQKIPGLYCA